MAKVDSYDNASLLRGCAAFRALQLAWPDPRLQHLAWLALVERCRLPSREQVPRYDLVRLMHATREARKQRLTTLTGELPVFQHCRHHQLHRRWYLRALWEDLKRSWLEP